MHSLPATYRLGGNAVYETHLFMRRMDTDALVGVLWFLIPKMEYPIPYSDRKYRMSSK